MQISWYPIASAPKGDAAQAPNHRFVLLGFGVDERQVQRPVCEGFWRYKGFDGSAGWVSCLDHKVREPYLTPIAWAPIPDGPEPLQFAEASA